MEIQLFFVLLCLPCTVAEIYIYSTKHTATTGISGLPEFTAVSFLHGKQIDYYDSKDHALLPRQKWAKRVIGDHNWEKTTQLRFSESWQLQEGLRSAMESFGHREGVHTFQRMYGCFWNDKTGLSDGFDVYGYDGKNFLALDLESGSFAASVPQAKSMAREWNRNTTQLMMHRLYFTHECVTWLKIYFAKNHRQHEYFMYHELSAIVIPTITQYLRLRILPVAVCHVTGLSSKTVQMSWQKNEEDVHDFVVIGETLPNGDGSFQKTIYLYVNIEQLIKSQYRCALKFTSLTGESLIEVAQNTNYGDYYRFHARHSIWGSNNEDEDEYDEDEDDDDNYDEDYDEDDDWHRPHFHRSRKSL